MADRLTKAERSLNMSKISARDTKPEIIVRSFLHSKGLRFRKNLKKVYGNPDIILKNITQLFLLMAVSGIGMRVASMQPLLKAEKIFGKKI